PLRAGWVPDMDTSICLIEGDNQCSTVRRTRNHFRLLRGAKQRKLIRRGPGFLSGRLRLSSTMLPSHKWQGMNYHEGNPDHSQRVRPFSEPEPADPPGGSAFGAHGP